MASRTFISMFIFVFFLCFLSKNVKKQNVAAGIYFLVYMGLDPWWPSIEWSHLLWPYLLLPCFVRAFLFILLAWC